MRTLARRTAVTAALASLALAAAAAPSQARPAAVTGKLGKRGYTLVALAQNGKATSVRARGAFRLVPPARTFTLHLRSADGVYAGPVVAGRRSRTRVVVGLKAGARLGKLTVRRGYAVPARGIAKRSLNASISARARKAVPIGAGVFGRVRATGAGMPGSGRDRDGDGIPGAFDVDDDGDLILDNVERMGVRAAADPGPLPPPDAPTEFRVFSNLKLPIDDSLNANAGAVTDAMIDAAISRTATLAMQVPGDSVELDCGGLVYCSTGGVGRLLGGGAFPDAFDADGDGLGEMSRGTTGDLQLQVGATASQIGSGDAFIQHVTTGSTVTRLPGILNYIFSTTPAVTAWADGSGASGSIPYPAVRDMVGTPTSPIVLTPNAEGKVVATLTFWRPQRKPIEGSGEGAGWVDIGKLGYNADIPNGPTAGDPPSPGSAGGRCDAESYATADQNLSIAGDQLFDALGDRPANAGDRLTFSVDITRCLANGGMSWNAGEVLAVDLQAQSSYGDNAAQKIWFKRG